MNTISDIISLLIIAIGGTIALTLIAQEIFKEYTKVESSFGVGLTPNIAPQIIVNVPADFKPIQPLPGDTSVEGQRAVLFYSVFREAIDKMNPDNTSATADEVSIAADVAECAVEACYGEVKS